MVWERQPSNQTFAWPNTVLNKRLWENVGIGAYPTSDLGKRASFAIIKTTVATMIMIKGEKGAMRISGVFTFAHP